MKITHFEILHERLWITLVGSGETGLSIQVCFM